MQVDWQPQWPIRFDNVEETNHFFNLGYGWLCKHCSAEAADTKYGSGREHRGPKEQTSLVFARWKDATRQVLTCPRCGFEELVNKG